MNIEWYGHAAFKLTTAKGVRIIIDPYESGAFGGALSYGKITDAADIVLTSHDHADHNYTADIKGKFTHISKKGEYEVAGVKIKAIPTFHDPSKGKERGDNLIFVIEADELKVAHAGDLGHALDKNKAGEIGRPDVLFLPVGGFYTIDAKEASGVFETLKPSITIPMHFKTDKCEFPITTVEDFLKGKTNVKRVKASETQVSRKDLPDKPEIRVLQPAL
jgi:L-ascorbate metabolism protein UlaG (beta-lactamase superfamily)